MIKEKLRSLQDKALAGELSENPIIKNVIDFLSKNAQEASFHTKEHLLSTAVKLSESIAPDLLKMCRECTEKLEISLPVELYVYSSPQFNAACFKPENEKIYIMFSSSILEAFSLEELKYVLGHELGHYMFGHHDLPIGYILKSKQRPDQATLLKLFRWSRFAEISADRAGAFCSGNFKSISSALFKLSSGLSNSPFAKFDLKSYLKQIDELILHHQQKDELSVSNDWFSTHPFSPLRVKALELFFNSSLMNNESKISKDELELGVQNTLGVMDPDYLHGNTPEASALRELFIVSAFLIANIDGEISADEKKIFTESLGNKVNIDVLNPKSLTEDMDRRINRVNEKCNNYLKTCLLRDLVKISKVDGELTEAEEGFLKELSEKLNLSLSFSAQQAVETRFLD